MSGYGIYCLKCSILVFVFLAIKAYYENRKD